MALATQVSDLVDVDALSPETQTWLSKCPKAEETFQLFDTIFYNLSDFYCGSCDKKVKRKDLRLNECVPWTADSLWCQPCWEKTAKEYAVDGSVGDPDFRSSPWPVRQRQLRNMKILLYDGDLMESKTKKIYGWVKGYNPLRRDAQRVCITGLEDEAEPGTIDPDSEVINMRLSSLYSAANEDELQVKEDE